MKIGLGQAFPGITDTQQWQHQVRVKMPRTWTSGTLTVETRMVQLLRMQRGRFFLNCNVLTLNPPNTLRHLFIPEESKLQRSRSNLSMEVHLMSIWVPAGSPGDTPSPWRQRLWTPSVGSSLARRCTAPTKLFCSAGFVIPGRTQPGRDGRVSSGELQEKLGVNVRDACKFFL